MLCGLLRSLPFVRVQMWGCGVLPAALPALFSATLSPWPSWFICVNVGPQGLLVLGLLALFVPHSAILSPTTATRVLAPPTSLDVFIFYFLGVSPPCSSILCQFWLCEEAQCVHLCRHLGSCPIVILNHIRINGMHHGPFPPTI